MACNCATKEQIKQLYEKYGDKSTERKLTPWERIKKGIAYAGVAVSMVIIAPFLFLFVIYKGICDDDHKISLKKFFKLDKKLVLNGGEQSI